MFKTPTPSPAHCGGKKSLTSPPTKMEFPLKLWRIQTNVKSAVSGIHTPRRFYIFLYGLYSSSISDSRCMLIGFAGNISAGVWRDVLGENLPLSSLPGEISPKFSFRRDGAFVNLTRLRDQFWAFSVLWNMCVAWCLLRACGITFMWMNMGTD